jgi:hypothetical protein
MEPAPSPDALAAELLDEAAGRPLVPVFDDPEIEASADALRTRKAAADLLVRFRLAQFADEGRTEVEITNAGRYWASNGGYMAFLKEEPPGAGGAARGRNPEMEALRSEYMRLRLNTFWWTFGFSIAGLIFSVISILIAVFYGRVFP